MIEVFQRVFAGTESDCRSGNGEWCVIHACKSPCHQAALGYRGSLSPTHPNYLALEKGSDLFLNIIDPPIPLFKLETFTTFLDFAHKHWKGGRNILIHCNQGESRAPTLALLLMAKRLSALPATSYQEAAKAYLSIYPAYRPSRGIQIFLTQNWDKVGEADQMGC